MKRVLACILACALAGCISQKTWTYQPNVYSAVGESSTETAVVLPFEDKREDSNRDRTVFALIPLIPYGTVEDHTPENVAPHITSGSWSGFKPTEDFAQALANELKASDRYKEAYFDLKPGNADVVFRGEVLNTDYEGTLTAYGLSFYGAFPWLFGLPEGSVNNDLSLRLSCEDKSGRKLFDQVYTADHYHQYWGLYYMSDDFNYPAMLEQVYKQFIDDAVSSGKCH